MKDLVVSEERDTGANWSWAMDNRWLPQERVLVTKVVSP